ncbi:MAG: hypothetical protein IKE65_03650 [Clostridia bacterium]|nr:hypothetical protein [Clostridia bacterium]
MSLTSKLLSAAVTIGAAAALNYGLKKVAEKAEQTQQGQEAAPDSEKEIIGTAQSKISLKRDENSVWSYTMTKKGVVKPHENTEQTGMQNFHFIPLKDGVTELEFDYKPKGAAHAAQTITYNIEVRNGKVIRCDAAGDLEMIDKAQKE